MPAKQALFRTMLVGTLLYSVAIGLIFKDSVELTGFINILIVVLTMTLAQRLLDYIDAKLAA